jgi:hypothetical protein
MWVVEEEKTGARFAEVEVVGGSIEPADENLSILSLSVKNIGGQPVKLINMSLSCPNMAKTFNVWIDPEKIVGKGSSASVEAVADFREECNLSFGELMDYGSIRGRLPLYDPNATKHVGTAIFTLEITSPSHQNPQPENSTAFINITNYSLHFIGGELGETLLGGEGVFKVSGCFLGSTVNPFFYVRRMADVENVKLLVKWVNAKQFAPYFDYVKIALVLANVSKGIGHSCSLVVNTWYENITVEGGQVKGYVSIRKPETIITIDKDDFRIDDFQRGGFPPRWILNNSIAAFYGVVYYEGREGMMATKLPFIFDIKLLETS